MNQRRIYLCFFWALVAVSFFSISAAAKATPREFREHSQGFTELSGLVDVALASVPTAIYRACVTTSIFGSWQAITESNNKKGART